MAVLLLKFTQDNAPANRRCPQDVPPRIVINISAWCPTTLEVKFEIGIQSLGNDCLYLYTSWKRTNQSPGCHCDNVDNQGSTWEQTSHSRLLSAQDKCSLRFHMKTFSPIWMEARLHVICCLQEKLLQLLNHLKCIKICFGSWRWQHN